MSVLLGEGGGLDVSGCNNFSFIYLEPKQKDLALSIAVMYQSNRSFNIPPGQPPGQKGNQMPPPWENYLTIQRKKKLSQVSLAHA